MSSNRNNKGKNPDPGRYYRIFGRILTIFGFFVVISSPILFLIVLDPESVSTSLIVAAFNLTITGFGLFLIISGLICTGIGKIMNMVNPYKIDDEEDEQTNEK